MTTLSSASMLQAPRAAPNLGRPRLLHDCRPVAHVFSNVFRHLQECQKTGVGPFLIAILSTNRYGTTNDAEAQYYSKEERGLYQILRRSQRAWYSTCCGSHSIVCARHPEIYTHLPVHYHSPVNKLGKNELLLKQLSGILYHKNASMYKQKIVFNAEGEIYSSFSLLAPLLLSSSISVTRPVSGLCDTASGPPKVSKALWKVHSTASSIGLSNMNGRKGTAARPSCLRFLSARFHFQ